MDKGAVPAAVREVCAALERRGCGAYPVGGCVRDLLLGRTPEDWDVTTAARPEQVMALFPRCIPTGVKHGTVTVLTQTLSVEVTTFRREEGYADGRHPDAVRFDVGLTEDLSRRDFTVNAMALTKEGEVIDPFGGREDLERRLIRCVGEPARRFREDGLRLLRAARFAAQLDFTIEPKTGRAMEECAGLVKRVSRERIRVEMEKTLLSPRPEGIGVMIRCGALDHLHHWDKDVDLTPLRAVSAVPEARWRSFCALTGFSIRALPVERKLRSAVEHPELAVIPALALSGGELMALGLRGAEISAAQKRLACHVLEHPEDNEREKLLKLWREKT